MVAVFIFAAALWPLFWRGLVSYPHTVPQTLIWLGMWVIALIFLGRGVFGFLPMMNITNPVQPFARFNRLYYSPLCILLGLGFLTLVLNP